MAAHDQRFINQPVHIILFIDNGAQALVLAHVDRDEMHLALVP